MDATPPSPPPLPSISEQSLPAGENKRPPKSPPLAFEPTPNDALAPRIPQNQNNLTSPPQHSADMGLTSPPLQSSDARELQRIINQQAMALKLAHQAFAAERQAWDLERDKLFSRIMSFEQLLRVGGGYSPAKSPTLSPSLTSPQSKASNSHRLPSIAEDDNIQPLSARREGAPQSIELPRFSEAYRRRSVEFAEDEASPTSVKVEEINIAPRPSMAGLSPLPLNHQMEAGHTPGKRPATPPPDKALYSSTDGIEDTPTRNNTHINSYLVRSNDEESDRELKGPLNMPELPHAPGEENFTFDMLSRRLEQIEQHPEDINARPMVFAEPSPGLASPADPEDNLSPKTVDPRTDRRDSEGPYAPPATRHFGPQDYSLSDVPSNALSPTHLPSLSKQTSHDVEDKAQTEFENGGIKLKKKASVNFGAPFGQLGGFGGRKLS